MVTHRGSAQTFSAAITSPENGRIQRNHTHLTLRLRRVAHKRQTADDELSDAAICRHQELIFSDKSHFFREKSR